MILVTNKFSIKIAPTLQIHTQFHYSHTINYLPCLSDRYHEFADKASDVFCTESGPFGFGQRCIMRRLCVHAFKG